MMNNLDEVKELLSLPKKIVITTHRKPDGDAMGSSLGLYHYLTKLNHVVQVVTPTDYASFLHWLPGNDEVINYNAKKVAGDKAVDEADMVFCLDFNAIGRIEDLGDKIVSSKATILMIDHHTYPEDFAKYMYSDASASSTCEMVYKFIDALGNANLVDKDTATCLYTGLITDTGRFKHSLTQDVFDVAGNLVAKGANFERVNSEVFDSYKESRLRFFGYSIYKKLVVLPEFKAAYIAISHADILKYKIITGDTEGLVNYPLSIKTVNLAALIIDRGPMVKLSLRSKGDFPTNHMANKYFSGGGHLNASGGTSDVDLQGTIDKFLQILPEYKDQLNF